MSPIVGGRLEEVQRPRSLFGPDYLRLAVLAAVSIAVHGWLIAHTSLTARDSLGFARQALCLERPSLAPPQPDGRPMTARDYIRTSEHPPGYPLVVLVTDLVVRHLSERPLAARVLLSAQLAAALGAVLLVVPSYLTGRMLFGRNVGFAAALLFQVLPVPARITSDGLSEGVYLLGVGVALVLGVRAVRRPGISKFLLCGLATGAAYLVRPDGLMLAVGPGAVTLWLAATRRWPRDVALGRLSALAVGVALVAVPYMALIGKITNKPTGSILTNPLDAPPPIYRGAPVGERAPAPLVSSGPLLAEWWSDEHDAGKSQTLWGIKAVFKEVSKGANYVVWPLAIFAVIALRRRFATEPGLFVPVVVGAVNLLLLLYLAIRVGYVSERHTVLLTLIACQFAAAGLPLLAAGIGQLIPAAERLGVRVTAAGLLTALVLGALPFALKPLHANREGHKHAGEWLAPRVGADVAVVDPFCWGEWYAGRTLYRTSWNPPGPRVTYVILENENKGSPHSRLPSLPDAKQQAARGRVVYHWPENLPPEQATVFVYQVGGE